MKSFKKLKYGMVGGGNGGNIGNSHRRGVGLDSLAVLSAGCFTRDSEQNQNDGEFWGVALDRIYANYIEMAEQEKERVDKIDFVIIVTPNDTHYEITKKFLECGINVACEKPFTITLAEAEELRELAKAKNLEICITYTYAHYAMVHQAKEMIARGDIGEIIEISGSYEQDWHMIQAARDAKHFDSWMSDPTRVGGSSVTGSVGIHTWYLIKAMTGLKLEKVIAQFGHYPKNAPLEANSRIIAQYEGGVQGLIWTTATAIGNDCAIRIKINGTKGAIEWAHDDPTRLKVSFLDEPVRYYTCERAYLEKESRSLSRLHAGHPEGYYEAFGNIYKAFCTHLLDKKQGLVKTNYYYPNVEEGINGVKFIEACVESDKNGNIWCNL